MFRRAGKRILRASPPAVHAAVRIWSVGFIAALGQFIVDTPGGSFGGGEQGTLVGWVYASIMAVLAGGCGVAALLGWRHWRGWFAGGTLVGAVFFLPALATDTAVAASLLGWFVVSVSRAVFADNRVRAYRRLAVAGHPLSRAVVHLLSLSLFSSLMVVGFELTDSPVAIYLCIGLAVLSTTGAGLTLLGDRSARFRGWTLAGTVAVVAVSLSGGLVGMVGALGAIQAALLAGTLSGGPVAAELAGQFVERPGLLVIMTFVGIALLGAVALSFPAAAEGEAVSPLDALFTAVSATCVTGLIVVDTPSAFSPLGEVIVLALFQVGGLGIMVLSTFGTVILGGRLSLRGERALEEVLDITSPAHAYRLVRFIVLATLATELLGASILTWRYVAHGFDVSEAAWRGLFQAVSAFCNAGFSLQTDSIVMFGSDPIALATHGGLLVFGGLGFAVVSWIWSRVVLRSNARMPVQVRVVLIVSLVLAAAGSLVYGLLEWNATLAKLPVQDKILNAVFQSVSTRTAGFNSVDYTQLRLPTMLVMMALMFIGAAPGGTGGGIKVTTFAVLFAAVPRILGGQHGATLYGRSVPLETIQRAAAIAIVASSTAFVALFVLLLSESAAFVSLAFEVLSALGTVGLSVGATSGLTSTGKWVILATMLIGRVGPLTLALALGQRTRARVQYPETRLMVG